MTFPKISLDTIAATAAIATRQDMNEFAMHSMLDLMQEQPELTGLINTFLGNMIQGGYEAKAEGVDMIAVSFAQEQILKAAMITYGLTMAAVKAQVEADELNEAWGGE
jgi:hypothetical protein